MQTSVRDGVALGYEKVDGSLRPIVFVHGWCESDKPAGDYPMRVFADDLAWLTGELGLGRPVFVGHSMGGVIAFELAIHHLDVPAAIVMIDSPVVRPAGSRAGMPAFLEALRGPDYRAALTGYVEQALFLPTDEPERKADILARMPETARHVMIAAFEGMRDFDPEQAAGHVRLPSLYIAADDRPLTDLPHLFQLAPDMLFGQTVGSGHFCQLEVPDQINAMIERFLAILPATG